ncbi:hypothetical protein DL766_002081 [Monosporascus sp. MC13-8B]|uniref:DNA/RNA-binding protein Alba-like domain-containing protein n=1 Tax=Monosporascus cannonballus TaxID=155416 RepID=A0ABY0GWG7_9PEZI|nr:hypothetical protein DL762_008653 [Monosporascus cannonballus]RYO91212.1 hypothetical protein DL763_005040 [Monosporascus cannonballus]RYP36194.1 hypothetical protein DL766_002081 [Monosporascus sp. MC13-8B]
MKASKHQNSDATASKRKRTDSDSAVLETPSKRPRLGETLNLSTPSEIAAADVLEDKYHVQFHSVLSSSKIQKRVAAVLQHIGPTGSSKAITSTTKPRISILRARAADAGKLITIAEITKRELEERGGESAERTWFQYIALGEEIKEKQRGESKSIVEETVLGGFATDEEGDGSGDFETMKTPLERAIEGRPLVRGTAIMSLFLSRISVDELKKRYGEQTNTLST